MGQGYTPRGGTIKPADRSKGRCRRHAAAGQRPKRKGVSVNRTAYPGTVGAGFTDSILGFFDDLLRHLQVSRGQAPVDRKHRPRYPGGVA